MRWRITCEVDLGTSIPDEAELQPHDLPLEQRAVTEVCGLLSEAVAVCHQHLLFNTLGDDPCSVTARLAYKRKLEQLRCMQKSLRVVRCEEPGE